MDERGTMGQETLRACCWSRMPGMAQGSQRHEPPTLYKRLAVVLCLDLVSSCGVPGLGDAISLTDILEEHPCIALIRVVTAIEQRT